MITAAQIHPAIAAVPPAAMFYVPLVAKIVLRHAPTGVSVADVMKTLPDAVQRRDCLRDAYDLMIGRIA